MYNAVVSSFDGTLVDNYGSIDVSTILEIDRIRRKKILFIIATGRDLNYVLEYNRDFPFIDYIISLNGAYVYNVNKRKVIYKKKISITVIRKLFKKFNSNVIYGYDEYSKFRILNLDNLDNIYKIDIMSDRDNIDNLIDEISNLNLNITFNKQFRDGDYFVEITMLDTNKYTGLLKICNKEKIDSKEVIAIGDYYNDIDLVNNVGLGAAVENAISEVKKKKMKTSSNEEKGVELLLKKVFKDN